MADRIKPHWERYAATCREAGASEDQVNDLRAAFYSGAAITFATIDNAFGDKEVSNEEVNQLRDDLWDEIDAFGKEIGGVGESSGLH